MVPVLRRAIHGPILVSGEPLTNFQGRWCIQILPEDIPHLFESSGVHRYQSIGCSSVLLGKGLHLNSAHFDKRIRLG